MPNIKVILADDHTVVRTGISTMLAALGGIEVVGEACNGRETLALVDQLRPDLLLCDITMPEMNGLEVTKRVAKEFPNVRVIMLSMHTSEEYVWQALKAGATGYLLKDTSVSELDLGPRPAPRAGDQEHVAVRINGRPLPRRARRSGRRS